MAETGTGTCDFCGRPETRKCLVCGVPLCDECGDDLGYCGSICRVNAVLRAAVDTLRAIEREIEGIVAGNEE